MDKFCASNIKGVNPLPPLSAIGRDIFIRHTGVDGGGDDRGGHPGDKTPDSNPFTTAKHFLV